MAISPPGDIVLDVARAVEPAELEVARARLAQLAATSSEATFPTPGAAIVDGSAPERAQPSPDPLVRFEAMVLQTFIQSMLPEGVESVYGKGIAGEMWQSLLSEKLGETLAARGGIGIADRMLRDYYVEGETKIPLSGVSQGPETAELAERQLLADALVEELQRKFSGVLGKASGTSS